MADAPQERASALEDVYRRMLRPLYRFVYRQVGNAADAEDICADVFTRAVRWLRADAPEAAVRAWLWRAARSAVQEYWGTVYRQPPLDARELENVVPIVLDDDAALERAAKRRVERLLGRLPERQRAVLELRFLEGLSVRETAMRMGISETYVRVLQHRALKAAAGIEEESERT
ncbi:MAG: sigma-70 family RNA polymerase sigma factor [Firmicutes bacterium]|nr:sigma-70 family RNA polymerase sigma factor [Bacillota bacterium]